MNYGNQKQDEWQRKVNNMNVEYCIDEINEMLFAAVAHGGDAGGPYYSETTWMCNSIENFLKKTDLNL